MSTAPGTGGDPSDPIHSTSVSNEGYEVRFPKVTIRYCTKCRWMLRAAWFVQELLETFGTAIGEIALQPDTGGVFIVWVEHKAATNSDVGSKQILWDRKTEGGFPEAKELKRRLRDVIEPGRNLGHIDRKTKKEGSGAAEASEAEEKITRHQDAHNKDGNESARAVVCEDCK